MSNPHEAGRARIVAALFDIDGTLVDSNDAHARAWLQALAESGFNVRFERMRTLMGMGGDKVVATLALGFDAKSERGRALLARRKEIFLADYLPTVEPFARAGELVAYIHARGVRCIVASSSSPEELEPLLDRCGARRYFDHAIEPDEAPHSKPDPEVVVAALRWARIDARQAIMIGDTRFDIEAAHRANVRTIALRAGGAPAADLVAADAVYDDPASLLEALQDASLGTLVPTSRSSLG